MRVIFKHGRFSKFQYHPHACPLPEYRERGKNVIALYQPRAQLFPGVSVRGIRIVNVEPSPGVEVTSIAPLWVLTMMP